MTDSKRSAEVEVAWPLPQAQSHARSRAGRDPRQQIEQRAGVPRTEFRVLGGEARKVVLERHGILSTREC